MKNRVCAENPPLLLSIGCLNIDVVCSTGQLPARGQRVMSSRINRYLGGMSTNLASAAAKLDGDWQVSVELIAPIGSDDAGRWVEQRLEEYGVGTDGLDRISDPHTCHCVILVEDDGERAIVSEPSHLNYAWVSERMAQGQLQYKRCHVHVDGFHAAGVAQLFEKARNNGWRTSLDMDELPAAHFETRRFAQLSQAFDMIFINRACAQKLTKLSVVDAISARLSSMAAETGTIFLLTLGADGVCVIEPDQPPVSLPAMSIDSVDTTGAGDVFAGVFLCCWLNNLCVVEAAQHACVAGALATRGAGALGSLPTAAEIISMR